MRTRYSLILPIAAILSGVVLELNSLNLLGNFLPNDVLLKIWPAILVFVALDLIISQRRLIGGFVVLFFAAALFSVQFLGNGNNNEIWKIFLKAWPILLVLFGVDWIFSGRKLINIAVVIAGVIILVYLLLNYLDVPALQKLPFNIDLSSIIPTSTFSGTMPGGQPVQQSGGIQMFSQPVPEKTTAPITVDPSGRISVSLPEQNAATLNLTAASGKISLKAGESTDTRFVGGTILLDNGEKLSHNADLNSQIAQYTIRSTGTSSASDKSNWDLLLTQNRMTAVNAVLQSGYIKADLRSLTLSSVNIENKFGPIDVMVPQSSEAPIRINAGDGDVRVYIPSGGSINCVVSGARNIEYPQMNYILSGNTLSPRRAMQTPVAVEIISNNGNVQIISN